MVINGFLFKVLATLPVITVTPESTFLTLKKIKNYLRNATRGDRLSDLALIIVHRNIVVDSEVIIRLNKEL